VLAALARAARERDLTEEADLFVQAQHQVRVRAYRGPATNEGIEVANMPQSSPTYSLSEWRLMQSVRIALRLYPEHVRAIEKAAGPALSLVDEALRSVDPSATVNAAFYEELERRLNALADRRLLDNLKREKDPEEM
jgi:hypothetical protein